MKNEAFNNSIPSQCVCVGQSARLQRVAAAKMSRLTRAGHVSASLILRMTMIPRISLNCGESQRP